MAVATSENTDCGVHEWNKIQSYTEKKNHKFSASFMLLFAIIMFLPTRQLSRQKTYFFSEPFRVNFVLFSVFSGYNMGKSTVLYLEYEPK